MKVMKIAGFITLMLAGISCSSSMPEAFHVEYTHDNTLYVGSTKVDITPIPYGEDGSCPDGAYCFEVPVQKGPEDGCPDNKNRIYEGLLDSPEGIPDDPCSEGFIDANGNGWFDAIWLGGFNMARPATGVDPEAHLYARTFALRFNEELVVVVVLDNIGLPTIQLAGLRERIQGLSKGTLSKKSLLIFSVHNHEAPDTQGLWGPDLVTNMDIQMVEGISLRDILKLPFLAEAEVQFPMKGLVDDYWAWVENRIIQAVQTSVSEMKKASVIPFQVEVPHREVGCHEVSFEGEVKIDCNNNGVYNENRDRDIYEKGMPRNYQECFTNPSVPERFLITDGRLPYVVDYTVYGYQFLDENGKVVATFVVWGNHVEAMSDDNTALSGDWSGYLCNEIEKRYGGTCVFQIAPEGGLTTPLGTCIPYIDASGRYIADDGSPIEAPTSRPDNFLELYVEKGYHLKPATGAFERAKSLGRQIAKSVAYAIDNSEPLEVTELKNTLAFVNVPLYNPLFYVAGRLELIEGLSLLLRSDVDFNNIDDVIWKEELSEDNDACGTVMCLRLPINMVTLNLTDGNSTYRTGFITNPGELFPEYVVGRKKSSFYFHDAPEGVSLVAQDPNFPAYRYTTNINPQVFDEIKGLREVASELGYSLFFVLAEGNSTIGYEMPQSDFILVYEGIFKEITSFAGLIDRVLDVNDDDPDHNTGLYTFFHLTETDKYLTFSQLMMDTWERFSVELRDYNPTDGSQVFLSNHPNIYEEEVSMGPYTGDLVYNMLRGLLEYGHYQAYRSIPSDPNTDTEILALPKLSGH